MNNKQQEQKIVKSIFFVPIISLLLFATLIFISLFFYFNKFKNDEIQSYKNFILEERKQETKDILLSAVHHINFNLIQLNKNIKKNLKNRIDEAEDIINRILSTPNKSKKEKIYLIKEVLSAIRFNHNRGYYFAYDKTTKITLIHPIKKFLNKDMSHFKDKRGTNLIKLFDKLLKNKNSAYATIYFAKPDNPNKEFKKIVYIRYIPKLNWVIGTGEYIEDALNQLKQNMINRIEAKRYGQNGYFWIHSTKYILIAHPYRKKDIGKNDKYLKDIKGTYIIQKFIKEAMSHKNGAFITYYWKNPTTNKIEKKISFVYYIPKLHWIIGTGLYLKDIKIMLNKKSIQISKKINKIITLLIIILTIILIFVGIISYILSKHTQNIFKLYKNNLETKIENAIKENTKKDILLQQQSKLAAMGEMISAIAHQWRQPLNSLALNIELLVEDYFDNKLNDKYIENFETKQLTTIKFMSKTIDDFRNFFITKEKENFNIKNAIIEVKDLIYTQLKNNNIELLINGEDYQIHGYKNEFKQVILNLINNAKDAIIEENLSHGEISIQIIDKTIIITDNAKDIPDKIAKRIFEPYFTTKGSKGTGIGLYMSKMIIEKMDGEIYFKKPKQFIIKGLK